MKLIYTGPPPDPAGGALPLPEGWTAADGDEPDTATASAKVESGLFKRAAKPGPAPQEG